MRTKVVSYRVDPDNPLEADADAILEAYVAAGHTKRSVIANALLVLDGQPLPQPEGTIDTTELARLIAEFAGLLAEMQQMDWKAGPARAQVDELQARTSGVSERLLNSIGKSVRKQD